MGYWNEKFFPIVSTFAKLSPARQKAVIEEEHTSGTEAAGAMVRHLGCYQSEGVRLYELSQPAYATVEIVRERLGAPAAAIVESVLAGDTNSLEGLGPDEQRYARSLAGIHDIQLP
ncbi:MAG: hypothetical protein P4L81_01380 [Candidatus Pacebacteria bacterium]|nr:hypothetical protein [Candidatus Paceibacterota bacterium]